MMHSHRNEPDFGPMACGLVVALCATALVWCAVGIFIGWVWFG